MVIQLYTDDMIDADRHAPLRPLPWNEGEAATEIEAIVGDALAHFDAERFWPVHPADGESSDGDASFYFGAAGVIWALEYLRRIGATKSRFDFRPNLPSVLETNRRQFDAFGEYAAHGSFLVGDLGTALVLMRVTPSSGLADMIYARASANTALPIRELMWGMPGSMLTCVHMDAMTGEPRWRALFTEQAERLLGALEETSEGPLWTQDLYGKQLRYLGPVHGFAGNMIPLMRGWEWLTAGQRSQLVDIIPRTLAGTAFTSAGRANWPAISSGERQPPPKWLCQHCHGAPGMVTAFANAPFVSPELDSLLLQGGELVWAAGALRKGSNLCHGTGGNGYALLYLYQRTGDPLWLDRARAFAMTAIAQCREARDEFERGRYSLWTGDVGLAIYLWDCLTASPLFPTIDVF